MIEGALIFLAGMIIGGGIVYAALTYLPRDIAQPEETKYDKYRNADGLLSRKQVKAG